MPQDIVKGTHHTYGHEILYAIDPGFRQDKDIPISNIGFIKLYHDFIQHIKDNLFDESILFQTRPTFRIHFPNLTSNQAGLGVMHTDRQWNHPAEEINFWMPIYNCKKTASLLLESDYQTKEYEEISLEFGNILIFDSILYHGNQINKEGYTRFSMDFRIIPRSRYVENRGQFSQCAGLEFTKGGYYSLIEYRNKACHERKQIFNTVSIFSQLYLT